MAKIATTVQEIDAMKAAEEASPLQPEEVAIATAGRAALSPAQNALLSERDILQIIRGYQTDVPRLECTVKAFVAIAKWREEQNYATILAKEYPETQAFLGYTNERVYGVDQWGHPIIGSQSALTDPEKLSDYDQETLVKLVGQKLELYEWYKEEVSKESKVQRYKYTTIIDLAGTGVNMMYGKRKDAFKRATDVGTDNFCECLWKVYVVNCPWYLRGGWAMVKPWLHPTTAAKINLCGDPAEALQKLRENDGAQLSAIPTWMGGTHAGVATADLLAQAIYATKAAQAATATAAAAPTLGRSSDEDGGGFTAASIQHTLKVVNL